MDTNMKRVLEVVSTVFGVAEHDIMGRIRTQYVSRARTALYYALRSVPGSCMSEIERAMDRSHGTLKQGLRAHYRWLASDRDYVAKSQEVQMILGQTWEFTSTLQWIEAAKSMPPELKEVILLMPAMVSTASGYIHGGIWHYGTGLAVSHTVTHWAYLPQGVIK